MLKSLVKSARMPSLRAFAASADPAKQATTASAIGAANDVVVDIILWFFSLVRSSNQRLGRVGRRKERGVGVLVFV
jgi:hypothetical protein